MTGQQLLISQYKSVRFWLFGTSGSFIFGMYVGKGHSVQFSYSQWSKCTFIVVVYLCLFIHVCLFSACLCDCFSFVYQPVHLHPSICMPFYLSFELACGCVCPSAFLSVSLSVYVYVFAWVPVFFIYLPVCLWLATCLPVSLPICVFVCQSDYLSVSWFFTLTADGGPQVSSPAAHTRKYCIINQAVSRTKDCFDLMIPSIPFYK